MGGKRERYHSGLAVYLLPERGSGVGPLRIVYGLKPITPARMPRIAGVKESEMQSIDESTPFFDLVGSVRAMLKLKPDPVPIEMIWKVLNVGVQAPSGQNKQPWKFLLIQDPERKQWFAERYANAMQERFGLPVDPAKRGDKTPKGTLASIYHQMDHMAEAPYLLLVCGKRDWPFKVAETTLFCAKKAAKQKKTIMLTHFTPLSQTPSRHAPHTCTQVKLSVPTEYNRWK